MAIDSCDHGNFIVVYEFTKRAYCPVCELKEQVEDLKNEIEVLQETK